MASNAAEWASLRALVASAYGFLSRCASAPCRRSNLLAFAGNMIGILESLLGVAITISARSERSDKLKSAIFPVATPWYAERDGRGPPRQIAQLCAAPLKDFVKARDTLPAKLRGSGRPADAAAVSKLRKPTPAVWAINRVSHADPAAVTRFIDTVDRLKRAHFGEPGPLAQATEAHRAALDRLLERAKAALPDASVQASATIAGRISATLQCVSCTTKAAAARVRITARASPGSRRGPRRRADESPRARSIRHAWKLGPSRAPHARRQPRRPALNQSPALKRVVGRPATLRAIQWAHGAPTVSATMGRHRLS